MIMTEMIQPAAVIQLIIAMQMQPQITADMDS